MVGEEKQYGRKQNMVQFRAQSREVTQQFLVFLGGVIDMVFLWYSR